MTLNETQVRYKEALKDVIKLVLLGDFKAGQWTAQKKISNMFIRAAIQLDYVDKVGGGGRAGAEYSTNLTPEKVTDEMAFKLNDRVKELVKQRNAKSVENKKKKENTTGVKSMVVVEGADIRTAKAKEVHNRVLDRERKFVSDKPKKEEEDTVHNIKVCKEATALKERDIPTLKERMDEMEERVMERINALNYDKLRTIALPKDGKPLYIVNEDKAVFKPLSDWSDEHILSELCSRGYDGSLSKMSTNGSYTKMETIELNKKED